MHGKSLLLAAALTSLAASSSCRESQQQPARYVASVAPLGMILQELVAGRAEVTVLLPPGTSPHTFDPTPAQAREASSSRAVFYVSDALDGWAADLGGASAVEVLTTCLPASYRLESQDPHEPGADPHFWTDPEAVLAALPGLAEQLAKADPAGSAEYMANQQRFADELRAALGPVAEMLAPARGRPALLMHPSFLYLFQRYGLRYAGSIEEFAGKEPSPKELAQLRERVTRQDIKVLFTEPGMPKSGVEVLASECGLELAEIYPESCPPGASTYIQWLKWNAAIIAQALTVSGDRN